MTHPKIDGESWTVGEERILQALPWVVAERAHWSFALAGQDGEDAKMLKTQESLAPNKT